jgi:hypothetical protein
MNLEERILYRFPTDHDLMEDRVQSFSDLINAVYDGAESSMWKRKGTRTTPDQVNRLLKEKSLILADLGGVVIGLAV